MRGIWSRALVVLLTVLEIESFVFLLHDFETGPFFRVFLPLGAHCLTVALLAIGFIHPWDYSKPEDQAWAVTAMCLTLPVPLLGFLGFLTVYALSVMGPRKSGTLLRELQEYISYDPTLVALRKRGIDEERFIMGEVDVAPLREILTGNDVALKRGAILSLARLPKQESVALLKIALSDQSREIRYYASTALSDMEREFNDRIFRLVREIERTPTTIEHHIELARLVLDYVDSGLLDEGMVPYFLDIGLHALDRAVLVAAKDPRIYLLAARLNKRAGKLALADVSVQKYITEKNDDPDGMLLAAEIAFERRDIGRVRDVIAKAIERFPQDKRFQEIRSMMEPKS